MGIRLLCNGYVAPTGRNQMGTLCKTFIFLVLVNMGYFSYNERRKSNRGGDSMASKPPYAITEKSADYLAKIVETATRLEYGTGFNRNILLHRENRLQTIH